MKKRKSKKIWFIILFLLIALGILIAIYFKAWNIFIKTKPELIIINDECSVLFNQILHKIKDSSGCENICLSECRVREKEYYDSNLIISETACHTCECYCK